jgi:transposase
MQLETEVVKKVWFGLDVHEADFVGGHRAQGSDPVQVSDLRRMKVRKFARDLEGTKQFLAWVDSVVAPGCAVQVVMESTGSYSAQLACWLTQLRPELPVSIVNARKTKHYAAELGVRSKTDPVDARVMACYGAERQPSPDIKKPSIYRELRSLSRCRHNLVEMSTKLKLQSQEVKREEHTASMRMFLLGHQEKLIEQLDEQIEQIEQKMEQLVHSDANVERDADLLDSIKGVGRIVAMGVLGEMGDLRDYHRSRQCTCFAGMDPRLIQSGKSQGKTRLSKRGPNQVRHLLYLAATATLRSDNYFSRRYERLLTKGKTSLAAIGAVMRTMLTVMRAILISGVPYDDSYERNKKRHPRQACA